MSAHILPDSRLASGDSTVGSVMIDGIEYVPIFCGSCGHPFMDGTADANGWPRGCVPKESMTFLFWLCDQCFSQYGGLASTYATPDQAFCEAVAFEMQEKFGRALTDLELYVLSQHNSLGAALELLEKESPYKVYSE